MTLVVTAPDGVPEIRPGDDLAALLLAALAAGQGSDDSELGDGDVVLVTSKAVSKAEGRVRPGERSESLAAETDRVVARRGTLTIARTRHGLVLAAAGIDASNLQAGHHLLLPEDPDASARALRTALRRRTGRNVGVVVTDTAGRAWRTGQTDIAVGAAGLVVAEPYAGRRDGHGNLLTVTEPAVADELAGAAELAQGKLTGRPFAVVRGRGDLVLPPGEDGPGAVALVRPESDDLFGLGAREAVVAAVLGTDSAAFGAPVDRTELARVLGRAFGNPVRSTAREDGTLRVTGGPPELVAAVGFAHGWQVVDRAGDGHDSTVTLRSSTDTP